MMWQSRCAIQIQKNCYVRTLFVTLHSHKLEHLHYTLAIADSLFTDDGPEATYVQAFFFCFFFIGERSRGKMDA